MKKPRLSVKPDPAAGRALHELRKRLDLSFAEAAAMVSISPPYWQCLELGKKAPTIGLALAIQKLTGIPIESWISEKGRASILAVDVTASRRAALTAEAQG